MSTTLLLSAGEATSLGDLAPKGCKAAAIVGDRTMVDWTWENIGAPTVVCRSGQRGTFSMAVPAVVCDTGGGPAVAVAAAIADAEARSENKGRDIGPITIVYADTWVPSWGIPHEREFCGVAAARGGRSWDVVEDGLVAYRHVGPGEAALACVGLYRFVNVALLKVALDKALGAADEGGEVGMADVVNAYGLPFAPVQGWQDVGDPAARARWRPL